MSKTRKPAPLERIPAALAKTGFLLEHQVAEAFRASGWSVINNRYYVDDTDGKARELDLVAYRVAKAGEVEVVTGALVSCKKDAENNWVFMSRDKPASDPNLDWEPVHYWTDYEPLSSFLGSAEWKSKYVKEDRHIYQSLFDAKRQVFAFQLVSPDGDSPRNDKPIFDSVTGLLKALDHEINVLPNRAKARKRIYLFSLLVVVDAPLVDVQYQAAPPKAIAIERIIHLARYLVRKRDFSALVHFVRADSFQAFVTDLNRLAEHNSKVFSDLCNDAYAAVTSSDAVRAYFAKRMLPKLRWRLDSFLEKAGYDEEIGDLELAYSNEQEELRIEIDVDWKAAHALDASDEVKATVAKVLNDIARYSGKFVIRPQIPF